FLSLTPRPPRSTLFPYTTLFRSEGAFSATVSEPAVKVNHAWFRGGWWDALTMAWKQVSEGGCEERPPITEGGPSPGATLAVPFELAPGPWKTIALRLPWYSGQTNLRI